TTTLHNPEPTPVIMKLLAEMEIHAANNFMITGAGAGARARGRERREQRRGRWGRLSGGGRG
ncbi:hypothetical protein, partial [Micromonospora psammae]|uniref:hypothetical protein n=1 Tax=Micromonospora sp. CPCC 205556 TaxID=3122398 RepID=UPI002FEF1BFE